MKKEGWCITDGGRGEFSLFFTEEVQAVRYPFEKQLQASCFNFNSLHSGARHADKGAVRQIHAGRGLHELKMIVSCNRRVGTNFRGESRDRCIVRERVHVSGLVEKMAASEQNGQPKNSCFACLPQKGRDSPFILANVMR